jgi:hypothetical protein
VSIAIEASGFLLFGLAESSQDLVFIIATMLIGFGGPGAWLAARAAPMGDL